VRVAFPKPGTRGRGEWREEEWRVSTPRPGRKRVSPWVPVQPSSRDDPIRVCAVGPLVPSIVSSRVARVHRGWSKRHDTRHSRTPRRFSFWEETT
jgi:hypothetical protein